MYLKARLYFTGETDNIKTTLKVDHNIPDARPVIIDMMYLFLPDGGDGKYYLWNTISDDVARIEEPNLQKILAKLGSEGLSGIKYTVLTE
jgi:hypothetical protein